ncbi:hypothetical protein [Gemmatimonas aurantiaca]|uniref:hypothetical protein n=1 Tax=Gemmatimonas aurantiaca TaxID=173480 RepID=UPI00301DA912
MPMIDPAKIVEALEWAESRDASAAELDALLASVDTDALLWSIADRVVAYPAIMGAIYRRATQGDLNRERALGYLALSHASMGDLESAVALLGRLPEESHDEVVLSAWALLSPTASETIARLNVGTHRLPHSLRLWRQLANVALHEGFISDAQRAYLMFAKLETTAEQQARIARILDERGWRAQEPREGRSHGTRSSP